jgi:putative membrane protein
MFAIWDSIKTFVKGMIMGAANVFPISSGTVSLVLGVFERFINAINSLRIKNFKLLFKGEFTQFGKRTDFRFLITIVLGLLAGMVLTSMFLKQTLNSYKVYTWSFFIGLIIASVVYVMKSIDKVNIKNILFVVAGAVISFFLSIKSNPYPNDSFLYLFLCGIIGATGMVVPGVSGSHLMLLMGNYELIVTKGIPWLTKASTFVDGARIIVPFVLGALVSIVMFSHLLAWLMREYRDSTLSVLAGFMLGSLPVVYPWKVPGESTYLFSLPSWNNELLLAVVMAGLGFATVFILELLARHSKKKQQQRLENPKPKKQRKHKRQKRQKKQKKHGRKTKKN